MLGRLRSLLGGGSVERVIEHKLSCGRNHRRTLHIEPLEDRRLLAVLIGGGLGGGGSDIEALNDTAVPLGQSIGGDPSVTLANFRVDNAILVNDPQDNFRYRAASSGRLIVSLNASSANVDFDVLDSLGNSLIGGQAPQGSTFTIPVVANQNYFISVLDTQALGNGSVYNLELENIAAPQPSSIDLAASSDTGDSNTDNVTSDTTPTILVQADLSAFAAAGLTLLGQNSIDPNNDGVADDATLNGVGLYVSLINLGNGVLVDGFANQVGNTNLWTFTSSALTPGDWFVSSAVQVVDGQDTDGGTGGTQRATGRAQLSDPLTITIEDPSAGVAGSIDLLASSDSGMNNADNVTNKWEPTFSGAGPANAKVHLFAQGTNAAGAPVGAPQIVASGVVGTDLSDGVDDPAGAERGIWQLTSAPLVEGKWLFTTRFETSGGQLSDPVGLVANLTTIVNGGIPDGGSVNSPRTVTAADFPGSVGNATNMFVPVSDVEVTVNITHPIDAELDISLISPNGTVIDLSSDNGGAGDNYTGTIFDDAAATSITAGTAPFTGRFRPEVALSGLNGQNALGDWVLRVADDTALDAGTLIDWTLRIVTPLMVVIDKTEPNTPLLDLTATNDTGRNNVDNETMQNMPLVTMTTTDPNIALAQLLFTDNLKFRVFDRFVSFGGAAVSEFLLYDSVLDAAEEALNLAGDMFTAQTLISEMLPQQFFTLFGAANAAILNVAGVGKLADGIHNFKLEVEDRAGNISHDFLLPIEVDTVTPPVAFGQPGVLNDGLKAGSDTGVPGQAALLTDRITKDTTPTVWGLAEANSVVRVFVDVNLDGIVNAGDILLGQAVATPFDGNRAFADGYWELTSSIDLNDPTIFAAKDGLRQLLVTSQDVAGNTNLPNDGTLDVQQVLRMFVDTQGPQVNGVFVTNNRTYDLFDPKPSTDGPTPVVNSLDIDFIDFPARTAEFLYAAINNNLALVPGQIRLVGDHVGNIPITNIQFIDNTVAGGIGRSTVRITFAQPLPDDRYTITVDDTLLDNACNELDGESNAAQPLEVPLFPSGNLVPGTDFVGRFTVDTRPEIGAYIKQNISIDTNGNFVWDPAGGGQIGGDATNRDIQYTLPVGVGANNAIGLGGFNEHDLLFAGKFSLRPGTTNSDGFDTLAAYGFSNELNQRRWLVDRNHDGVVNVAQGDILNVQPSFGTFNFAGAIPVAANIVGGAASDDEIGLYFHGTWWFDTNKNFVIDAGDTSFVNGLMGHPIAGDFDGDGADDLAVFNNNQIFFNFANDGLNDAVDQVITWGYPGVLDRPVAADYDRDGIDDIGLWVPRNSSATPNATSEWYILVSNDPLANRRVTGSAVTLNHPFTPIPFGKDIYAEFGNDGALPIFGNFDPPVARSSATPVTASAFIAGDYNRDGAVDGNDRSVWVANFGSRTSLAADGNGDGVVDSADYTYWADRRTPKPAMSANTLAVMVEKGDLNADGRVGTEDLDLWRKTFGTTNRTADLNGDSAVDAADYSLLRDRFGRTNAIAAPAPMSPPGASVAVASAATNLESVNFASPSLATATPIVFGPLLVSSDAPETLPALASGAVSTPAIDFALMLLTDRNATTEEEPSSEVAVTRTSDTTPTAIDWALEGLSDEVAWW